MKPRDHIRAGLESGPVALAFRVALLALACATPPAHAAGWTVGAGSTLTVGGSVGGDVAVASGGVLAGVGSVNGNVSVASGGVIAPGNPAGTLSVGNLALDTASVLNFGLGSVGGLIQVNGNLTLDGAVNVTALSGFGANSYRLLDYTGSLTNNALTIGSLPAGYAATVDAATTGQVNLAVSAIDTIPDTFSFSAQTGAARSTVATSNTITVSGINSAASISIAGGEYAVSSDGGNTWSAWSATTPVTVSLNDQIKVRLTSSASYSTPTTATLTIGGVSGAFAVTTLAVTTSYTAPSATGTGNITAVFTGGGAGCTYTVSRYIPLEGHAASPPTGSAPPGVSFPYGLFDFTAGGCTAGSTIAMTITYPQALPPGVVYWKYGPSPAGYNCTGAGCAVAHWYQMPPAQAVIAGNTVTLTITDGGVGDDDLTANGVIVDQGGPGVPVEAAPIPTLSEWAAILLSLLMVGMGPAVLKRRG